MGNNFSEENYKICVKCNNKRHIRNDNLEIINSCLHRNDDELCKILTFRCSEGHIFKYSGCITHIDSIIKYNEAYWKNKTHFDVEVYQLKKENAELKQKLSKFTENCHSATTLSVPLTIEIPEQPNGKEIVIAKVV
jgi:hypothetical protein